MDLGVLIADFSWEGKVEYLSNMILSSNTNYNEKMILENRIKELERELEIE